jgi:hypothetical protein
MFHVKKLKDIANVAVRENDDLFLAYSTAMHKRNFPKAKTLWKKMTGQIIKEHDWKKIKSTTPKLRNQKKHNKIEVDYFDIDLSEFDVEPMHDDYDFDVYIKFMNKIYASFQSIGPLPFLYRNHLNDYNEYLKQNKLNYWDCLTDKHCYDYDEDVIVTYCRFM